MSRAFVKETDAEEVLPIPPLLLPTGTPNLITPAGAARLRAELVGLLEQRTRFKSDGSVEATARLRNLAARITLLEQRVGSWVESTCPASPDRVVFGVTMVLSNPAGHRRTWQIVGVDEVEVTAGRVSFLSPLAQAMLGARVGDVVTVPTPRGEEVWEIEALSGLPPG